MIKQGETIPEAEMTQIDEERVVKVLARNYFKGARIIVVGMPGPFTPTCSQDHLPGYLHLRDELMEYVDGITVIAITDAWAMEAWSVVTGARGQIDFLADGNGEFSAALGLIEDRIKDGMGARSRRYAMLVDDGVVEIILVEKDQSQTKRSSADRMLAAIRDQ